MSNSVQNISSSSDVLEFEKFNLLGNMKSVSMVTDRYLIVYNSRPFETPQLIKWEFISKKILRDYILIMDEKFFIEKENDMIYLTHDKWSLVGVGKNLIEAEKDLMIEAKELFNNIRKIELNNLSQGAIQMRDFLFKIF
jgi:hypothetical protein